MKDGKLHHRSPDLTGQTFGMLTALNPEGSDGRKVYWRYRCACGGQCVKVGSDVTKEVKRPGVPNCGCASARLVGEKNRTHGMTKHPAYAVWRAMLDRCRLPSHRAWKNYGGRGITVCAGWVDSFETFWRDMGPGYARGLELDRERNDEGYSPENCRWVSRRTQTLNKRTSVRVADIPALSAATGISRSTLYYRAARGLPLEGSTTSSTAAPGAGS